MKNTGYDAWKARLEYMVQEFPFTKKEEGIVTLRNEEGRLHSDTSPAWRSPTRIIWYQDGRKHGVDADIFGTISYYFENIRVPPKYFQAVSDPSLLDVEEVLRHRNQEVKYVGMKIVGFDRVIAHPNTKIIHEEPQTNHVLFEISGVFEKPIRYVKVFNKTPELDGSYKPYYLCVPPETRTCREGVAWTFRMTEEEYQPSQES